MSVTLPRMTLFFHFLSEIESSDAVIMSVGKEPYMGKENVRGKSPVSESLCPVPSYGRSMAISSAYTDELPE